MQQYENSKIGLIVASVLLASTAVSLPLGAAAQNTAASHMGALMAVRCHATKVAGVARAASAPSGGRSVLR